MYLKAAIMRSGDRIITQTPSLPSLVHLLLRCRASKELEQQAQTRLAVAALTAVTNAVQQIGVFAPE